MRTIRSVMMGAALCIGGASMPVSAAQVQVTGTINQLFAEGTNNGFAAESTLFSLSDQPAATCTGGYALFVISPNSVTDAQTRKNMIAMLLAAKLSGASITVTYENTVDAFCDQRASGVYYIYLQ